MLGTGRTPNVETLNCEAAKVKYDTNTGIIVNDNLQTANKDIYAVGDCCSKY